MTKEFTAFQKIPRLSRGCVITEKIDGTNASIYIGEDGEFLAGSRNRWITPEDDNFGFAKWAYENKESLLRLGYGQHFGEWWGSGIQRAYGLKDGEKRFSLFNVGRWKDGLPEGLPSNLGLVPVLYQGAFSSNVVDAALLQLKLKGSQAVSGFMRPEGVIVYHAASGMLFKKTIEKDEEPKGKNS